MNPVGRSTQNFNIQFQLDSQTYCAFKTLYESGLTNIESLMIELELPAFEIVKYRNYYLEMHSLQRMIDSNKKNKI